MTSRAPLAPVLMVQGTASGVGKSLLTAGLCRLAARDGIAVAPFKAQNMSNNAAVTTSGGEIGRAQALQAVAAGVEAEERMNPILLKPMADTRSEVVRMGRTDHVASRTPWRERRALLWATVTEALDSLRGDYALVIAEGAGSPAETNLRSADIVNMAVARHAQADVLLVADIDRGGAFASLYGSWALLDTPDRDLIRGFVLNRFRGDASLLDPAPKDLTVRTGVPVLGVVPFIDHLLPEEDGGPVLDTPDGAGVTTIGVVGYPFSSNLDDLDPLRSEPHVRLRLVRRPRELKEVDGLILPGSRNTLEDLRWLRETGLADTIRGMGRDGLPVAGLCGGYQMLGHTVVDPDGIEGGGEEAGLGLLDVRTEMAPEKERRLTAAAARESPHRAGEVAEPRQVEGYEIHHGRTEAGPDARPWLYAEDRVLGHASGSVWGCYLHGVFSNDALRADWLDACGAMWGGHSWQGTVDRELDRLADVIADSIDATRLFESALGRSEAHV